MLKGLRALAEERRLHFLAYLLGLAIEEAGDMAERHSRISERHSRISERHSRIRP